MSEAKQSFGEQAARFGLYAPFVVLAIGWFTTGSDDRSVAIAVFSINMVLILSGFALSVIALASMRRYGRRGILGRGIAGLLFNGLVLAAVATFLLPKVFAGNIKGQIVGHWRMQANPSTPGKQIDITFSPGGKFHFVMSDSGHAPVMADGDWVLTPISSTLGS